MSHVWGIDLGGTKIEGVVLDPAASDQPLCRTRIPTEAENGYRHIVGQIVEALPQTDLRRDRLPLPEKIGMGTPGVTDPRTGLLKNSSTPCLNRQPLGDGHRLELGRKFVLANDANCFALAEATLGARAVVIPPSSASSSARAWAAESSFMAAVLEGCHGIAGEWGQTRARSGRPGLPPHGTHGTVEALDLRVRRWNVFTPKQADGKPQAEGHRGAGLRLEQIRMSTQTIERLTDYFAQALCHHRSMSRSRTPSSSGAAWAISMRSIRRTRAARSRRRIFNPTLEAALLKLALGDSAGVFGAAMLVSWNRVI